jgi:hypothetical protein
MKTTNNKINKWNDFSYKLNSQLLTNNQISLALESFYFQELLPLLNSDSYNKEIDNFKLLIIFKIKTFNFTCST